MARLSKTERRQLATATKRRPETPAPEAPLLSPRAYLAFATFAARFGPAKKPVRFGGDEWKL
jgi:hypothetical protein